LDPNLGIIIKLNTNKANGKGKKFCTNEFYTNYQAFNFDFTHLAGKGLVVVGIKHLILDKPLVTIRYNLLEMYTPSIIM